jgi:hypothetical protein
MEWSSRAANFFVAERSGESASAEAKKVSRPACERAALR